MRCFMCVSKAGPFPLYRLGCLQTGKVRDEAVVLLCAPHRRVGNSQRMGLQDSKRNVDIFSSGVELWLNNG
jgi:hypothetical protein